MEKFLHPAPSGEIYSPSLTLALVEGHLSLSEAGNHAP